MAGGASVIEEEVRRFDALAEDWWNPAGPMAPLHRMNPIRLRWLRNTIARHFSRTGKGDEGPLDDLAILDVGCGAGLISEPLSRLGARVTGLDPAPSSIFCARAHAEETGASPTYRQGELEDLAQEDASFDVVLAMEVVEHVNDAPAFVATAASLIKPGGMIALSTLNRTLKSFALAIVGAEYILRWLTPGTHRWEQFVTPAELEAALKAAGLTKVRRQGLVYNPLTRQWSLSKDCDVNYFMSAALM
jgi:2-polyprenyl-6-hydroxyphenyl methylase/3-demethylubiquinone-9 3-methyltransferase